MGGRRPYSLTDVFGKSAKLTRDRRKVSQAVKEGQPAGIAALSAQLLLDSDRSIRTLAQAAGAFSHALAEAKKEKPEAYADRRRSANRAWAVEKRKRVIQTSLLEDRIFTESLARALKRRKRRR